MRVRVKICGITRLEDALAAVDAGADALGFNFWPGSRRFITAERAAQITHALPPLVHTVGVFVNQPRAELERIAAQVGLSALQLHGDETPADASGLSRPVIRAISVKGPASLQGLDGFRVAALLLDAPSAGYGGSGTAFDWTLAVRPPGTALILAGGLTPLNVQAAIRAVRPDAVDVASGVESAPGIKDATLMQRFIRAANDHGANP